MRRSAVAVDDPCAVEVVRGQLAAHAVAGQDADPKAPHLSGYMSEHDVVVVELHAEHRVRQGLDHLALEFDLVLLCHSPSQSGGRARRACLQLVFSSHQTTSAPLAPAGWGLSAV